MAKFLKPSGIDLRGYDASLNKQTVGVKHYTTVGLTDGWFLKVTQNDASVADVDEQPARKDMRILRVSGLKPGFSMLEAKDDGGAVRAFMQIEVTAPPVGGKKIVVDLTNQTLEAIDAGQRVYQFDCVTGDSAHPTDKGTFKIFRKDRIHRSSKYNVQMNFAMFFTTDGKAIHQYHGLVPLAVVRTLRAGTDWFGSHGCIRLTEEDAKVLFDWAPNGTIIEVK
jgi:lipoprotein-anchoring transpeptidase ErfK/SrfK